MSCYASSYDGSMLQFDPDAKAAQFGLAAESAEHVLTPYNLTYKDFKNMMEHQGCRKTSVIKAMWSAKLADPAVKRGWHPDRPYPERVIEFMIPVRYGIRQQ